MGYFLIELIEIMRPYGWVQIKTIILEEDKKQHLVDLVLKFVQTTKYVLTKFTWPVAYADK